MPRVCCYNEVGAEVKQRVVELRVNHVHIIAEDIDINQQIIREKKKKGEESDKEEGVGGEEEKTEDDEEEEDDGPRKLDTPLMLAAKSKPDRDPV